MKFYDAESYSGTHVVRLTFMYEDYVGHVSFKIGGNCHGKSILQSALDFIFEDCNYGSSDFIENDCQFEIIESDFGDQFRINLANENGDSGYISDDLEELADMIIAVEIIDYKVSN